MKSVVAVLALLASAGHTTEAFSMTMKQQSSSNVAASSRRAFFTKAASTAAVVATTVTGVSSPALAATAPEILTTEHGIKYAILKKPQTVLGNVGGGGYPQKNDVVAIEYTGYLTNGQIWDSTHAEGKSNALSFFLGTDVVIDGLNEMVSNMQVGEKVQAIIPPELAFGDKGLCLDDGECLIKKGATLVYDIYLKRSAIAPP